jgi:uncharacterized protein
MKPAESIELFLSQKRIAVAGVSRTRTKFGNTIYLTLKKRGRDVVPVNPNLKEFNGDPCFSSVAQLPDNVQALVVCLPSDKSMPVVESAIEKGIRHFWIQQGAENPELIRYLTEKEVNFVSGRCILMFAEPVNCFHSFHRFMSKLTGNYPK